MSGPANADNRLIHSIEDMIAIMREGEKPANKVLIGAEHEKFLIDASSNLPLAYEGKPGIKAMLEAMLSLGDFTPYSEVGKLIALKGADGGSITLEPGGQFELSGAPLPSLHHICMETNRHLAMVKKATSMIGAKALGMGFYPELKREDFHWMPKGRYQIMKNYMPKKGNLGLDMMLRTCTVQVNLDYCSEIDMAKKMRVSAALQPIATALFAASPFLEGKPSGYKSWRSHIWSDTDPDRCGMPACIFQDDFGYRQWLEYILDVPMYFIHHMDADGKDKYLDLSGESFRSFLAGNLKLPDGTPAGKPTRTDFADHMTTAFPEVRAKTYIEMRGADAGPWENLCALPALWVGLLYDQATLDEAYQWIKPWSHANVLELRELAPKYALEGKASVGSIADIAKKMVALADQGLKARNVQDTNGRDESHFLAPLHEINQTGKTLADKMLEDYHGKWGGKLAPLYDQYSYHGE